MGAEEHYHAPVIRNLLTEELIKSEIIPHLPDGLHVSKGEIIKDNDSSGDCDLIIYKKPILFQYGSVAIVPFESAKAIIEIKICARDLVKGLRRLKEYKNYAGRVFAVAMHGHFKRTNFQERKNNIEEKHDISIFTLSHSNGEIVEGELQRLLKAINDLGD
jgi:hypothetical protein